nr:MAG TPA: hypothetical protein [Caudoviricetes sp.]
MGKPARTRPSCLPDRAAPTCQTPSTPTGNTGQTPHHRVPYGAPPTVHEPEHGSGNDTRPDGTSHRGTPE